MTTAEIFAYISISCWLIPPIAYIYLSWPIWMIDLEERMGR